MPKLIYKVVIMNHKITFLTLCALIIIYSVSGCGHEKEINEIVSIKHTIVLLKHDDPDIRSNAAFKLGRSGKHAVIALDELANAINDSDARVRMNVARAIGYIGIPSETAVEALMSRFDDEDPIVKFFAMNSLTIMDVDYEGDSTMVLIEAIEDEDPKIRRSAISLLANNASDSVAAKVAVINALDDADSFVRKNAAWFLKLFDLNDEDIKALGVTLLDKVEEVQLNTCETLQEIGPGAEVVLDELIQAASDSDWGVRYRVVYVLHNLDSNDKVISTLGVLLDDSHPMVRFASCHGLGIIGPGAKATLPILRERLNDDDKSVRIIAAGAIAAMGVEIEEMLPIIADGLNDTDKEIINAGITAVMVIGPDAYSAVLYLIDLLSHESDFVRIRAVDALGYIGPEAASALPHLEEMLSKTEIPHPDSERSPYSIIKDSIRKIKDE